MNRSSFHYRNAHLGLSALGLAFLLIVSGCDTVSTISSRSKEQSVAYAAATPAQKEIINGGWIERGFSTHLVYIALGAPDRILKTGEFEETWIYNNFSPTSQNGSLGGSKVVATQGGGSTGGGGRITDTRNRANYTIVPDVGSTPPAEELRSLLIHFYDKRASRLEIKTGM